MPTPSLIRLALYVTLGITAFLLTSLPDPYVFARIVIGAINAGALAARAFIDVNLSDEQKKAIVTTVAALALCLCLPGCAAFDVGVRSRVSEVDPQVAYDRRGEDDYTVTAGGRIVFRDPRPAPVRADPSK